MAKIIVQNTVITVLSHNDKDYISLTDMAHSQMQEHIVFRWMSLKSTIEYLGEWEMLYNPNFNCTEFDTIRNAAGSNKLFAINPVILYEEAKSNKNVWFTTTEASKHYKKIAEGLYYCPSRSSTWNKMAILKNLFRLYQIDEDDLQFGVKHEK